MLVGREAELERIDALLTGACSHRGGALVIRGDPGIGKTALLAAARERAGGMQVATASGVEAEAQLPFAALGEIAAPLVSGISALPARQADAISAALGVVPAEHALNDKLALFAGILALIRTAAAERPLLILVDDAHWLDRPSAECLGYSTRRLGNSGAALLLAARPEGEVLDGSETEVMELAGLERAPALELLATTSSPLANDAADALVEMALGNPLALKELPGILSEEQRQGLAPIDRVPPVGGALADAYERRVAGAGPDAGRLLLVAAAALDRDLRSVIAASTELGIPPGTLEACERAGLLAAGTDGFSFAHPLLRGIVYAAAPEADRRQAHRALADQTAPDSRAWHLAAAAIGPDEEAARALEQAATRAAARGAHDAAADALERAAGVSSGPVERSDRLFRSGFSAAMGGEYPRAAALLERAGESDEPAGRVSARHLYAMVTFMGGLRKALDNHALLTEEAGRIASDDPAMAAVMHADAGVTAGVAGACDLILESAESAVACLPADAPSADRCQVIAVHGMALAFKGRTAEALTALDEAGALLPEVEPVSATAQSVSFGFWGRLCTGGEAKLRDEVGALVSTARERGSLGILPFFELQSAEARFRLGEWDEAEREADDAVANAEVGGQLAPLAIALMVRARIHAARGRDDAARTDIDRGVELSGPGGYGAMYLWQHATLGAIALIRGDAKEAIFELEIAEALATGAGLMDPLYVPWAPDLIEAHVRAGRNQEAEHRAGALTDQAEANGTPLALALAARGRALVASDFEPEFERALEHHAAAAQPHEHARTLLAYGSRLHRAGERVQARDRLRESLEIFERLGSPPWIELTRSELRAAGARERKRAIDPDELTAQEVRVAQAAAQGGTKNELAAQFYLSPKTIDYHLSRVYKKLGIHSRAELATLVAEGRLGPRA